MKRKLLLAILALAPNLSWCQESNKAEGILDRFLEKMEQNYSHYPLVHETVLKESEYLQKGIKLYDNVAFIEYFRHGYFDMDEDHMKLLGGENKVHLDTLFENHLYGGLAEIKKDVIKYPREFFAVENGKYQFKLIDTSQNFHTIRFEPVHKKSKYSGILVVNAKDLALTRVTYTLSDYGMELLNRLHAGNSFKWNEIHEEIVYEKPDSVKHYLDDDDRYYLKSITTTGKGYHAGWEDIIVLETELTVTNTNRTTFFANEFYTIDDNVALSKIDYEPSSRVKDDEGQLHISHSEMIVKESSIKEESSTNP